MTKRYPPLTGRRPDADALERRGGLAFRLLLCDECRACWPTERDEAHGGSRQDNEPCAYRWPDGRVCQGHVHPMGYVPPWERHWDADRPDPPEVRPPRVYVGNWCKVLELDWGTTDLAKVRRAYRTLSKRAHPDAGGSHAWMVAVNEAYRQALSELAQPGK